MVAARGYAGAPVAIHPFVRTETRSSSRINSRKRRNTRVVIEQSRCLCDGLLVYPHAVAQLEITSLEIYIVFTGCGRLFANEDPDEGRVA